MKDRRTTKRCADCHRDLPRGAFYRSRYSNDGRQSICKEDAKRRLYEWRCKNPERRRAIDRRYHETHRERRLQQHREWMAAHPGKMSDYDRKRLYNLSPETYAALVKVQGRACAICRRHVPYALRVDHDHASRRVRGLLCHRCNVGLGFFDEDLALFEQAMGYLMAPPALRLPASE